MAKAQPRTTSSGKSLKGIVAGGITGGTEIMITYPTEYVKTQLQLDEKGEQKRFNGALDVIKKTVKERGIFGLYRGLSILLLGSIPKTGTRFGAFEFASQKLCDENGNMSGGRRFLAGLAAGITEAIVVVTPMETIKVKLINDMRSAKPQFKGLIDGVRQIVKAEGIGGIYKGLTTTVMRQGSNQAIRFFVMYTLRDLYTGKDPNVKIPKPLVAFFGIFAGAASALGNNPVDVVKTRMQGLEAQKYKNSLDCAFRVLRNEGAFAFYKGITPRLIRVCMDASVTFTVYDIIMDVFNKVWK